MRAHTRERAQAHACARPCVPVVSARTRTYCVCVHFVLCTCVSWSSGARAYWGRGTCVCTYERATLGDGVRPNHRSHVAHRDFVCELPLRAIRAWAAPTPIQGRARRRMHAGATSVTGALGDGQRRPPRNIPWETCPPNAKTLEAGTDVIACTPPAASLLGEGTDWQRL